MVTSDEWRAADHADKVAEVARLRAENAALRERLKRPDGQEFTVPQGLTLGTALEHVRPDARPGDRLKMLADGTEYVLTADDGWVPLSGNDDV